MRITNKIIQNNSLNNINKNKVYEDKLNTMLATRKKIVLPSDDPVVAIRALRLRTNLTEVTQYYEKNVPDAESWMSITEDAIDKTLDVIENMYSNCTTGSAGFKTAEDRMKILESLKGLREELYATGDADYAGRYVFSGYRTDMSILFSTATTQTYSITEQLGSSVVEDFTYVNIDELGDLTIANAEGLGTVENDITTNTVHRIRLAYEDCDEGTAPTISYYDNTGTLQTVTAEVRSMHATPNPYLTDGWDAASQAAGVVFIPETGELILDDTMYAALSGAQDDITTNDVNEGEIRITYDKSDWDKNDLRPEHYFYCETEGVEYNEGFLTNSTADDVNQIISYDIGFSQTIRVNTLASEVYTHNIGRDIDEMIAKVESVIDMEATVATLAKMLETDPDNTDLQQRLAAANKAYDYLKEDMQMTFEHGITKTQGYLDQANLALTNVGNRTSKLELVSNRLMSQQTNFKTLASNNEDVDLTEIAVQLSNAELAYEAALMATGKVAQTTLLNYL